MKDFSSKDLDFDLWVLLRRTSHVVLKARDRELAKYGISAVQAAVLFLVRELGRDAIPAEISRQLLRDAHSVSGLLSRMEKDGLVRKVKDLDRKNLVRVELTEKGNEAFNKSTRRESISGIMSSLPDKEQRQLMSYLRTVRDTALKELGK